MRRSFLGVGLEALLRLIEPCPKGSDGGKRSPGVIGPALNVVEQLARVLSSHARSLCTRRAIPS